MTRSFDLVDKKVFEADFFLEKLRKSGVDIFEANCYLNAFISSARTITYALQAVMKDIQGFQEWYKIEQSKLKQDELARFFHSARNESQHIGLNLLGSAAFFKHDDKLFTRYHFIDWLEDNSSSIPSTDVVTSCNVYLKQLVNLIFDCYSTFGNNIDPDKYYTVENLTNLGLTIEDIEEQLGFPRGWTYVENSNVSQRLNALRRSIPGTEIDIMFLKYLDKRRYQE